ncbi:MAG: ribosomal RNA small subunit methyltransferase I [Patescibacteria group bacterium]
MNERSGTLFIVATPIGNLEDITLRAIRVLQDVDLIACEDTRVTRHLLDHFEIKTPTVSYFQHSKLSKIDYLISELRSGKDIALISDAGTPAISDPGQELIANIRQACHSEPFGLTQGKLREESRSPKATVNKSAASPRSFANAQDDIRVVPIPGPSALTAAASVSGMIEKEFYFAGFLPKKKGRQTELKKLSKLDVPIIMYESTLRLERTLADIKTYFDDKTEVFVAREMTKMFEEYWGGKIDEVLNDLKSHKLKGEIVLVVKKL